MGPIHLLLAYLYADFLVGLFHFLEDSFFSSTTPIIGPLIYANRLHHEQPRYLLRYGYWGSVSSSFYVIAVLLAGWYVLSGSLSPTLLATAFFAMHANLLHKYSHMTEREWPMWYRCLRAVKLVQANHHLHHQDPYDTNFCILTDWLNPILDYTGFWYGLRSILLSCGVPAAS